MNFFEHQDRARQRTGRLIGLFVVAVVLILIAVNAAAFGIMRMTGAYDQYARDAGPVLRGERQYPGRFSRDRMPAPANVYIGTTCAALLIIAGGSLYKTAALSRGGPAVAQLLGGRPINPHAASSREQVLQNVVEEMSIASGVPMPHVYVLDDEDGINAFAGGWGTDDAAIGVTRGALETLNRDELQGVIAHEFSHILNGDMRLNLRLIGILHGILLIALIGFMLLRAVSYSGRSRSYGRRSGRGGGAQLIILILIAGAAMIVIGYIGVFFGRLIQAAVSRQREYLADASAVQFTRNPSGLAGALKKIGYHASGSRVDNPHALETAHLFFGSSKRIGLTNLLATHPPLELRIKALDPAWDGRFDLGPGATQVLDDYEAPRRGEALASMLSGAAQRVPLDPQTVTQRAGDIARPDIQFADGLLAAIPQPLEQAARDPFSARAVVFALLANREPEVRRKQLGLIGQHVEAAVYQQTMRVLQITDSLPPGAALPVLDLSLPALRQLSPAQARQFRAVVRLMIEADGRVTLFEYTLNRLIEKLLGSPDQPARVPVQFYSVSAIREDAVLLLSALAAASTAQTDRAFAVGARRLDAENPPAMVDFNGLGTLDRALKRLASASPGVKQRLIDAAAHTIAADGAVNPTEAQLLRATAATLDVPLPANLGKS
jgi:Zn-dependent protease with chaperone function